MSHNEKRCYNKRAFEKQMQDPMALLTSLTAKSHAERVDKASGGSNSQPQIPRNARADRRGQPLHGSPAMQNPAAQSQLQTQQSMQQMQQMPDDTSSLSGTIPSTDHDDAATFQ
jgi:hypothetical protein